MFVGNSDSLGANGKAGQPDLAELGSDGGGESASIGGFAERHGNGEGEAALNSWLSDISWDPLDDSDCNFLAALGGACSSLLPVSPSSAPREAEEPVVRKASTPRKKRMSKKDKEMERRRGERVAMELLDQTVVCVAGQASPTNALRTLTMGQQDMGIIDERSILVVADIKVPVNKKMRVCETASKVIRELWKQLQECKTRQTYYPPPVIHALQSPRNESSDAYNSVASVCNGRVARLFTIFSAHVLPYLEAISLCRANLACKDWSRCCSLDKTWESTLRARWNEEQSELDNLKKAMGTWKKAYRALSEAFLPPRGLLSEGDLRLGHWKCSHAIVWILACVRSDNCTTRTVWGPSSDGTNTRPIAVPKEMIHIKLGFQSTSTRPITIPQQDFTILNVEEGRTLANLGHLDERFAPALHLLSSSTMSKPPSSGNCTRKWEHLLLNTYDYCVFSLFVEAPGSKTYGDFFASLATHEHAVMVQFVHGEGLNMEARILLDQIQVSDLVPSSLTDDASLVKKT